MIAHVPSRSPRRKETERCRAEAVFTARRHRVDPLRLALLTLLISLTGCSLAPAETADEEARIERAGRRFEVPIERRAQPDLPARPTWRDVLQHAFLANGDLEEAYFEWKAAVDRVGAASAYPNTNLSLGYTYTFSPGRMKTFDRMAFAVGFDAMENLSYPGKVAQAGRVALEEVRAAGEQFRAAKFDLQRRVLLAWADDALFAEKTRIAREQLRLARLGSDTAAGRVRAGRAAAGPAQGGGRPMDGGERVKGRGGGARLDACGLERPAGPGTERRAGAAGPTAGPPPAAPQRRAASCSRGGREPRLASLSWQSRGRTDALELARLQWTPDVNPSLVLTGGIAQGGSGRGSSCRRRPWKSAAGSGRPSPTCVPPKRRSARPDATGRLASSPHSFRYGTRSGWPNSSSNVSSRPRTRW